MDAPLTVSARAVDVNCSIGRAPDRTWKFETADALLGYMDEFGIDRAVVWHRLAETWSVRDGNETLLKEIASRPRLRPCLMATPHLGTWEMPAAAEYRVQLAEIRPAAVRLHPKRHEYRLLPYFAGPLLEILNELRLPVLLPWEELDPADLAQTTQAFPDIPFVLLRAGYKVSRCLFPFMQQSANVFVSTNDFLDTNLLEEIVARFGAQRVLFGSDMPRMHPGPALALVCYADAPPEAKAKMLGGNWRRLEESVRWK